MSDDGSRMSLRSRALFGRQDNMGRSCRSFLTNIGTPQDRPCRATITEGAA